MYKITCAILSIIFYTTISFAQMNVSVSIEKDKYSVDNVVYNQTFNEIKNTSNSNVWIIFEKDITKSDIEILKERFFNREKGMSYIEFIFDGNVNWEHFEIDVWSTFFKIIPPGGDFLICTISQHDTNIDDIMKYLRVINVGELSRYKVIKQITPDTTPSYQPNVITLFQ